MRNYRRHLGPRFSEGARLLWTKLERLGLTAADVRREVRASSGLVEMWLYGEKVPRIEYAGRLNEKFGIPVHKWVEQPKRSFVPPAART